jgi:hypothetical protein
MSTHGPARHELGELAEEWPGLVDRVEAFGLTQRQWTFFMAQMRRPSSSNRPMILPMTCFCTASGLMIERVRSIATETSQNGGPD